MRKESVLQNVLLFLQAYTLKELKQIFRGGIGAQRTVVTDVTDVTDAQKSAVNGVNSRCINPKLTQ